MIAPAVWSVGDLNMPNLKEIEFVNRTTEVGCFREMLDNSRATRVLKIKGPDGWGKTWLLYNMYCECQKRGWPVASIDLGTAKASNVIELLISIREQIRQPEFDLMDHAVQDILSKKVHITFDRETHSSSRSVNIVAETLNVDGDLVAGDKFDINLAYMPDPAERVFFQRKLKDAFYSSLRSLTVPCRAALLLDDFHSPKATKETRDWLTEDLIPSLLADEITSLVIVITSHDPPEFKRDWKTICEANELRPLPEEAVVEYWLERRKLPLEHLDTIKIIIKEDSPQRLAEVADSIEKDLKFKNGGLGR